MKRILSRITTKVFEAGLFFAAMMPVPVLANHNEAHRGVDAAEPRGVPADIFGQGGIFETIANTLIFLVGAISVIMLIIGGFRYVISAGDSQRVEGAKNTILYAIVGLVVAILAFAAVSFVLEQLK